MNENQQDAFVQEALTIQNQIEALRLKFAKAATARRPWTKRTGIINRELSLARGSLALVYAAIGELNPDE